MSLNEKIIVFDEDGNPKEFRYYEAEKLVARLGTILDSDNNFIGLRELSVEEVSPISWFDKLRHKPQPKRIDITTVDFIGLINWINTIKTIKTIEKIEEITEISKIGSPLRIRDSLLGASQIGLDGSNPQEHPHINDFYAGMKGDIFPDWTTDIDLKAFWNEDGMKKPVGVTWLNAYSRKVFVYPIVACLMQKGLGTFANGGIDYFCGFERGDGIHSGIASWITYWNTVHVAATMGGSGAVDLDITSLLPADYKTAGYYYGVKVNRNNIQFWYGIINTATKLTGIAILAPNAPTYSLATAPYAVGISAGYLPSHMPVLAEVIDTINVARTMPLAPRWLRASDGDPCPPEIFRLYKTGTTNLIAGLTLTSGSVTSHPFPTFGYEQKIVQFMSDKAGTLELQILGMSGNWRTYDSITTVANVLDIYRVQGMPILMRIVFTPSAYNCIMAEAEVFLS